MADEKKLETPAPRLLGWNGAGGDRARDGVSQIRVLGHVLAARRRLIAAFVAAGLIGMAVVTLLTDRYYTATAVVHVENDPPHVTKIDQMVVAPRYRESVEYFQDQVSLLKSRTLMAAVIRDLSLKDHPRFDPPPPGILTRTARLATGLIVRLGGTAPPPAAEARPGTEEGVRTAAIDRYAQNLEVKPIPNSRLIQVRATARDPDLRSEEHTLNSS